MAPHGALSLLFRPPRPHDARLRISSPGSAWSHRRAVTAFLKEISHVSGIPFCSAIPILRSDRPHSDDRIRAVVPSIFRRRSMGAGPIGMPTYRPRPCWTAAPGGLSSPHGVPRHACATKTGASTRSTSSGLRHASQINGDEGTRSSCSTATTARAAIRCRLRRSGPVLLQRPGLGDTTRRHPRSVKATSASQGDRRCPRSPEGLKARRTRDADAHHHPR